MTTVARILRRGELGRPWMRAGVVALGLVGSLLAAWFSATPALASPLAAPLITPYAGTGAGGAALPGPALSSPENTVGDVAVDAAGNVYIADSGNQQVDKVMPDGTLSIIAGDGTQGVPTPGLATSSALNDPYGIAVDAQGDVYIADTQNRVVEKVTPAGQLSIVAGDGTMGTPTAGPATSSHLKYPIGPRVDSSGNLYIADENNHVVEKVTPGGILSIVAGNGTTGAPTPGAATSSHLSTPTSVATDASGNLYIADSGNHVVEKVTPGGTLSIVAGNGVNGAPTPGAATSSHLGNVTGIAVDGSGALYMSDSTYSEVEEVTTGGVLSIVAGNGTLGTPTYGGPATSSHLHFPQGLDVSAAGVIYIANTYNYTVDRVVLLPPSNTVAPVIPGTPAIGATVSTDTGGWTNSPGTFAYQWQQCDSAGSSCADITGATASTYTVTGSDVGHALQVVVTASNAAGSTPATSNLSAAVPAAPTTAPPGPISTTTMTPPAITTPTTTAPVNGAGDGVRLSAEAASAGIHVSGTAALQLPLNCPQAASGCDADGILTLALAGADSHAVIADTPSPAVKSSVIAQFAGVKIQAGHSRLVSVTLTPAATRYLQVRGIRRVRVTLTIHNHLSGGPVITTAQLVWLNIAALRASCPAASGRLTATRIGQMSLGVTRDRAHRLGRYRQVGRGYERYCLLGGFIRVNYPVKMLLRKVSATQRRQNVGRVILALTANSHYAIGGVHTRMTVAAARARLTLGAGTTIGKNTWYLIRTNNAVWVLKAQHGIIREIGITTRSLTSTRQARRILLRNL